MDKVIKNSFEQIREYIVFNDIEVDGKDDLIKLFVTMSDKGYFYEAKQKEKMKELRSLFSKFANYYEEDKAILDKDLIFFGPRAVFEKIQNYKKR